MSVKVKDNSALIKLEMTRKTNLFLRFVLDDVDRFAEPITPKKEGELRRGTLKTVSGNGSFLRGTIKWIKEYAAAQEVGMTRGFPIRNYTTPGTDKHYAQRAVIKAVDNAGMSMRKAGLI